VDEAQRTIGVQRVCAGLGLAADVERHKEISRAEKFRIDIHHSIARIAEHIAILKITDDAGGLRKAHREAVCVRRCAAGVERNPAEQIDKEYPKPTLR